MMHCGGGGGGRWTDFGGSGRFPKIFFFGGKVTADDLHVAIDNSQ